MPGMPAFKIGGHDIGKRLQQEYNTRFGGSEKPSGLPGGVSIPSFKIGGYDVGKRLQHEYNARFGGNGKSSGSPSGVSIPSFNIGGHDVGKRLQQEYNKRFGGGKSKGQSSSGPRTSEGYGNDKSNVIAGLGRSSYRDAGMVYARSLLGGVGGKLTEKDFSPENRKILEQSVKRAESRQQQKIAKARQELAADPKNKTKQSSLNRLLKGQVRLEYGDYASKMEVDKKTGKWNPVYTDAEDDLKNILGQSWFEKQKGGGYRSVNEKYDFQEYKDPWKVLKGNVEDENKDVKKSGATFQKRLEAFHQIMKGWGIAKDLDADVMIGGLRPKDTPKNQKALEAKRPWWDKMGWFGGGSAVNDSEKTKKEEFFKKSQEFSKQNPGARLYNKPQTNTGQSYVSRFARPRSDSSKPKPRAAEPTKPKRWGIDPRGWFGKKGGGLVHKSISDDLQELRSMRSDSLERQGRNAEAYGLRTFGIKNDMSSLFAKGLVSDNTGFNIPGATSDRQLTALQPGEYVVPGKTVSLLGKNYFDNIVSSTDPNSKAAKSGIKPNPSIPEIKPYSSDSSSNSKPEIINLPPVHSSGGKGEFPQADVGSKEVFFSPICEVDHAESERNRILDMLGVVTS